MTILVKKKFQNISDLCAHLSFLRQALFRVGGLALVIAHIAFADPSIPSATPPVVTGLGLDRDKMHGNRIKESPENIVKIIDDPNYVKCDFNCLYHRANENISLQYDYLMRKKLALEGSDLTAEEKKKLLEGFCPDPKEGISLDELVEECVEKFNSVYKYLMPKFKSALARNDASAKLIECMKDSHGECVGEEKLRHLTRFQSEEMANTQRMNQAAHFLRPEDFQKIALIEDIPADATRLLELESLAPQEKDYMQYQCEPLDAKGNKKCEAIINPATGEPVLDAKAFKQAQAEWNKESKNLKDWMKNIKPDPHIKTERLKELGRKPDPTDLQRAIYDQARKEYIDEINQYVNKSMAERKNPKHNVKKTYRDMSDNSPQNGNPSAQKINEDMSMEEMEKAQVDPQKADKVHTTFNVTLNAGQIKTFLDEKPTPNQGGASVDQGSKGLNNMQNVNKDPRNKLGNSGQPNPPLSQVPINAPNENSVPDF